MLTIDRRDVTRDGCTAHVVTLEGEAGVREGHELSLLMPHLAADRPPVLVFDVGELTFISSLAIGELTALTTALAKYGCRVCLAGTRREIANVFDRAHLSDLLRSYPSVDAAIRG